MTRGFCHPRTRHSKDLQVVNDTSIFKLELPTKKQNDWCQDTTGIKMARTACKLHRPSLEEVSNQ